MGKYQFSGVDINAPNNSHAKVLQAIKPNSTVLEFGPSKGYVTNYLKNERGCQVYIVEYDADDYAEAIVHAVDGYQGDAHHRDWADKWQDLRFDYIVFGDVLEHLYSPLAVLQLAVSLLKDDGRVVVSIPNIGHNAIIIDLLRGKFEYKAFGLLDDTHIRFFTYDSLCALLEQAGLLTVVEDGIYLAPHQTEFQNSYELLGQDTEVLMANPYGHVYQFVFQAAKKAHVLTENIPLENLLQTSPPMQQDGVAIDFNAIEEAHLTQHMMAQFDELVVAHNLLALPDRERTIYFIIAVTNEEAYLKCLEHLQYLFIPEGFFVKVLPIRGETRSLLHAYNRGLHSATDGKYKCYLNQDVLVLNKYFLYDFLRVFIENPKVSLSGVRGSTALSPTGYFWQAEQKVGDVWTLNTQGNMVRLQGYTPEDYQAVQGLDGLLLFTQYDVPFNEGLWDGEHFFCLYDTATCIEHMKAGYTLAVPRQTKPVLSTSSLVATAREARRRYGKTAVYSQRLQDLYGDWLTQG